MDIFSRLGWTQELIVTFVEILLSPPPPLMTVYARERG